MRKIYLQLRRKEFTANLSMSVSEQLKNTHVDFSDEIGLASGSLDILEPASHIKILDTCDASYPVKVLEIVNGTAQFCIETDITFENGYFDEVVFEVRDHEGVFSKRNSRMTFFRHNSTKMEKAVEIGVQSLVEVVPEGFSTEEVEVVSIPAATDARLFHDFEDDSILAVRDVIPVKAGRFTV